MQVDVYVVDENERPHENLKVTIHRLEVLGGQYFVSHTDDDGHAQFSDDDLDAGPAMIYVDDERHTYGPYDLSDGSGYTFQIDQDDFNVGRYL